MMDQTVSNWDRRLYHLCCTHHLTLACCVESADGDIELYECLWPRPNTISLGKMIHEFHINFMISPLGFLSIGWQHKKPWTVVWLERLWWLEVGGKPGGGVPVWLSWGSFSHRWVRTLQLPQVSGCTPYSSHRWVRTLQLSQVAALGCCTDAHLQRVPQVRLWTVRSPQLSSVTQTLAQDDSKAKNTDFNATWAGLV